MLCIVGPSIKYTLTDTLCYLIYFDFFLPSVQYKKVEKGKKSIIIKSYFTYVNAYLYCKHMELVFFANKSSICTNTVENLIAKKSSFL